MVFVFCVDVADANLGLAVQEIPTERHGAVPEQITRTGIDAVSAGEGLV